MNNCKLTMKYVVMQMTLLSTFMVIGCVGEADIIVNTQQGFLRGTTLTSQRSNRTFYAFMGIPFAKPPEGDLRFKAPHPPDSWNGIRNATVEGNVCPQVNEFTRTFEGAEDCLFLNVYIETLPNDENETLIPVMVSIHGGGFWFGSGNRDAQGPDFLVDQDVIVVTINYRLGILGFLSLQNAEVPGNNGLKDQVMALRWIQQNIAHFGGDPNKVTIFGISAGGASVGLHMLSPMSQGLFNRAISQSGAALNPWSISSPAMCLRLAMEAAEILNISTNSTQELWHELKNASLLRLWPVIRAINVFRPSVDVMATEGEVFLPDTPRNMLSAGQVHHLPYITGLTSNEGIVLLKDRSPSMLLQVLEELLSGSLGVDMNATNKQEATTKLKEFYFGDPVGANATVQRSIDLLSDLMFFNGIYCTARKQAELSTAPIYMYEFAFSGYMNIFKVFYGGRHLSGASHADDLVYIYRTTFHNQSFVLDTPEYITSERIVKMWTNFAKNGNPTPEAVPLLQNITWTPVTSANLSFLRINHDLTMEHQIRSDALAFWQEIYNNYTSHSLCG